MSGNEDHHRQGRRFAAGGNGHDGRDHRDVEIERLRQRVRELEINPFDRYEKQYEDTPTDTAVEEYENEEFHTLKQQTLTVEEFIAKFERVRMRCGVEENEEQTIAHFLGSLRTDISDVVYLQQYYSFHDVCRLASKWKNSYRQNRLQQLVLALLAVHHSRLQALFGSAQSKPTHQPLPASHQLQQPPHSVVLNVKE
nr:reverse transcriptase domain-containing protein [Tanacetum cinerariifolium]